MLLPVESKQIACCSYDEDKAELQLYFHTGEVVAYHSVAKSDYLSVVESTNRLDALMKLTQKGHVPFGTEAYLPSVGEMT
ncbi:KTSC domain-containing protein [Paenibacillus aurantiacus]|uniref:KTSC domain-containing protein n=1 Tax=Paenibacillus aurantiacus TaxID=1936118 RepID=A0ABV5KVT0_9BACL